MKKSEIELDMSAELILLIIGLVGLLILISAVLLNLDKIGFFIQSVMGDLFWKKE